MASVTWERRGADADPAVYPPRRAGSGPVYRSREVRADRRAQNHTVKQSGTGWETEQPEPRSEPAGGGAGVWGEGLNSV